MTAVELATCLVPAGHESLAPMEWFVVVCAAFYEWGFGLPSHQFLFSLLRSYDPELHHLTPLGILHMASFVTLCEACIGIEPPMNPWCHFFWAWLQHDLDAEVVSLGIADILVHSGPGADS
jgi:hypothetical protein